MVEINFLCVHKKLRSKRLAPVLIKEVTRRVNRRDIWQAVYTAGVEIPQPISSATYWHRSLNPKMLIDIGFSHLRPKWTMQMTVKFYALPDVRNASYTIHQSLVFSQNYFINVQKPKTPGLRQMVEADVPQVCQLVTTMLKKYPLVVEFNEEEIKHWLFPVKDVVETWVVEDPKTKKLTDVLSFYALPSSIIGHPKYKTLKAAYSYYNVSTKTDMKELMNDALIIAKSVRWWRCYLSLFTTTHFSLPICGF
jgi:glycylpeptide N-tetradecanoyltransferase